MTDQDPAKASKDKEWSSPSWSKISDFVLEHFPQKLQTFVIEKMLYLFERRAISHRLGDSTKAESALNVVQLQRTYEGFKADNTKLKEQVERLQRQSDEQAGEMSFARVRSDVAPRASRVQRGKSGCSHVGKTVRPTGRQARSRPVSR